MARSERFKSEYSSWAQMKNRCACPTANGYAQYGGRGIYVCDRWKRFELFLADMGPKPTVTHSIERRDVNGPYTPNNCYWATSHQQSRNKRTTRYVTFKGETKCLADWASTLGIPRNNIMSRLKLGWTMDQALDTPVRWKLTEEQAQSIRQRLDGRNGASLGREFGVSRATISMIRNGHTWR